MLLGRETVIGPELIPAYARAAADGPEVLRRLSGLQLPEVERALVTNTLRDVGGNRERASQLLGISTRTLYRKIKEFGLARAPGAPRSADPARSL